MLAHFEQSQVAVRRGLKATARAGDMPVALMFDGPSLGGFVCPATITSTELWKMGQVSAKDTVLFKPVPLGALPALANLAPALSYIFPLLQDFGLGDSCSNSFMRQC